MKILSLRKQFLILFILLLADCLIGGILSFWREFYWNSIADKHFNLWTYYIAQFIILALVSCYVSGKSQYIANIASLALRTQLTRKALKLDNHKGIEGGAQRVQEDCMNYPSLLVTLIGGVLRSVIMILIFAFIIIKQMGVIYLLIPLIYALLATFVAGKIARPLINLNYLNQVVEAKFRQILSKLNYKDVHRNNFLLFKKTKHLQYFQSFYNQITIIIPHLILSFAYFGGKITFGVFMQVASSIAEITNNFSFLVNNFNDINRFLSCRKRLKELRII